MLATLLATLRQDVADTTGVQTWISPEGIVGSCAIVYPRNPWIDEAETFTTARVNFGVQLVADTGTNAWVLDKLAALADKLLAELPTTWTILTISGPLVGRFNGSEYQLLEVHVATTA